MSRPEAQSSAGPTSGSFWAGPVHGDSGVGLGPVDGPPPGGLTEAPRGGRQLREGGLCRARAPDVFKRVSAVPGVRPCYGGVGRPLGGARGHGAEDPGGLGHWWRGGEIFNGWHCKRETSEAIRAGVINVLALNSRCFQQRGERGCSESRGLLVFQESLLPVIQGNKKLPAASTSPLFSR